MKDTWYSTELNHVDAMRLRWYLKEHKIKFETSDAYYTIHFEINCNEEEMNSINNYLDMLSKEGS